MLLPITVLGVTYGILTSDGPIRDELHRLCDWVVDHDWRQVIISSQLPQSLQSLARQAAADLIAHRAGLMAAA